MLARSTLFVLIIAAGVGVALAQSDPVTMREHLMKENNNHAKVVVQMMKGQRPFDAAAVDAAFAQWAETAKELPGLFPENAKTGGDNRASPKIWMNKTDFEAKIATFAKTVAENRDKAKSSLEGLRATIPVVGKACDNCHKEYRLSKQ